MRSKVGKLLALPWRDRLLLLEAATALLLIRGAQAAGGLRFSRSMITAVCRGSRPPGAEPDLERIAVAVRRAAGPLGYTCLGQSLAVLWLLRRRGIDAELCFGAKVEGTLAGHAWVEARDHRWTFDTCPGAGYARLSPVSGADPIPGSPVSS
jgi:hypothetical protein